MQAVLMCLLFLCTAALLPLWLRSHARAHAADLALQAVERSRRLLLEAIEVTPCRFTVVSPDGVLLAWNSSFQALQEPDFSQMPQPIRYEDLIRASARRNLPADKVEAEVETRMRRHHQEDSFEHLRPDGTWVRIINRRLAGGEMAGFGVDITELKQHEAALREMRAQAEHLARHDPLTGIANRMLFRERLDQAVAGLGRGQGFAVLLLDLNGFKAVNDTLGHGVGDELLVQVGARLTACAREVDLVARLGGDEFAVVQSGIGSAADAGQLGRRIIGSLAEGFTLGGHDVLIGASIGIVMAPDDGAEPDALLQRGDMALYRAKAEGRGACRFYEPAMDARVQELRALEADLCRALAEDALELHFQPIVQVCNGAVTGFEALVRWTHPERGPIPPSEFIALAEDTGLIALLGEWILRRACRSAASWPEPVRVAVNLSPAQFKDRRLADVVATALRESGLAPSRLELEITEGVLLVEDDANLSTLHAIRALGVCIAMDDFGTGHSSLGYLRRFPFDKIKIDQSFVRDLSGGGSRGDGATAIIRAVTSLGSSLGLATTAEGVETAEQLSRLRLEGCTEAQGYLFSPPRPENEVPALLRRLSPAAMAA